MVLKVYLHSIINLDCLNEPPSTERYAWWCERSVGKLIIYLLLDLNSFQPFIYSTHRTDEPSGEHRHSVWADEVGSE